MIWLWKTEGAWSGGPEALARKTWMLRTRRDLNASLKPQLKKPWGPEAVREEEARGCLSGKGSWLDCKEGWGVGAVGAAQRTGSTHKTSISYIFLPMAILCQQVYIS